MNYIGHYIANPLSIVRNYFGFRSTVVAFLLGVLALQFFSYLPHQAWTLLLVPGGFVLWRLPALRIPVCLLLGFLWALFRAELILSHRLPDILVAEPVRITGTLSGLPEVRSRVTRFEMVVSDVQGFERHWPSPGRIRLAWYDDAPRLSPGQVWTLWVRLKRPHGFMNPGGFDYERWLFARRVRATGYVLQHVQNRLIGRSAGEWINHRRHVASSWLSEHFAGLPTLGLLQALAIGSRTGISDGQWQVFRATGTNHLVAISGLHIGLVASLGFFAGRWLWSLGGYSVLLVGAPRVGAISAILSALGYAAMAGFSIPTQRALIMLTVVMVGLLFGFPVAILDLLALSLLLVVLIDPLAVLSTGFWLSFGAVGVIVMATGGRVNMPARWRRLGHLQLMLAIGLLPLLMVFFNQVPLLAPLANIVAVPWVSLLVVPLLLLGFLSLPLSEGLTHTLLEWAGQCLALLLRYLEWLAAFDHAVWHRPALSGVEITLAVIGVVLLLAPKGLPGRWLGVLLFLPVVVKQAERPLQGEFWFTLLDVGQGLSAVVQTQGHVLVYDTGPRISPSFDTGALVVAPFLRHQGITQLDRLVVSHGDNDHAGGASSVVNAIPTLKIITSAPVILPGRVKQPCQRGQAWHWDGVDFSFVHPYPGQQGSENDLSCVLRITNGHHSLLLTGDIEHAAEEHLLLNAKGRQLKADILVVPHHGSDTSSSGEFVSAVKPRYALFPTGYRNRFGFPDADVEARYLAQGAELSTTGDVGAISFRVGPTVSEPVLHRVSARRFWHDR